MPELVVFTEILEKGQGTCNKSGLAWRYQTSTPENLFEKHQMLFHSLFKKNINVSYV